MEFHRAPFFGPLLFLVYVDDFKRCLNKSDANVFADDTTILATNKSLPVAYFLTLLTRN